MAIPAGFAEVIVSLTGPGSGGDKMFSFAVDNTPALTTFVVDMDNWLSEPGGSDDNFHDILSPQWTVTQWTFTTDTVEFVSQINEAGAQSVVTPFAAPSLAALVVKGSGLTGRKNRGRMFIPGVLPEDGVDEAGTVSTTLRNELQAVFSKLYITVCNAQMVILHEDESTPTPVTQLLVSGLAATQRRRMRK